MSEKALIGFQVPDWTFGAGVPQKIHAAAISLQKEIRAELQKLAADPRLRADAVPALKREAATRARRSLRRLDSELQLERGRLQVATERHLRSEKDSTPRAAELRSFLLSMDIGKRAAFVAQAAEAGDTELLRAVHSAPRAFALLNDEMTRYVADTLDAEGAEELAAQADAIQLAGVAVQVVSGEIESATGLKAGQFQLDEQRDRNLDSTAWTARESTEGKADRRRFNLAVEASRPATRPTSSDAERLFADVAATAVAKMQQQTEEAQRQLDQLAAAAAAAEGEAAAN